MITIHVKDHIRHREDKVQECYDALDEFLRTSKTLGAVSPCLQSEGDGTFHLSALNEMLLLTEVKKLAKESHLPITINPQEHAPANAR